MWAFTANRTWIWSEREVCKIFTFSMRQKFEKEQKMINPECIFDHFWFVIYAWKHNRRHTLWLISDRLIELKKCLVETYSNSVDPVEYLAYLYFECWLWLRDISKRLEDIWVDYPSRSLSVLLWETFWWQLRTHNEWTKITERKNKTKDNIKKINTERTQAIKEQTSEFVAKVLNWRVPEFSSEECGYMKKLPNIEERIVFMLVKYNLAQDKKKAADYMFYLETIWQSRRTIATNVQNLFDEAHVRNPKLWEKPTIKVDYISSILKAYWY